MVGWVMAIKVLLFSFGAMSYAVLWDNYITSPNQWFGIWERWDFGYYQEIAEFGYSGNDGSIAFYPLFPWLVRLVACVSRSYLAAGFIVAGIASVERSCCEDSFALITRRGSQCAASGSFSFFQRHISFRLDIAKACF